MKRDLDPERASRFVWTESDVRKSSAPRERSEKLGLGAVRRSRGVSQQDLADRLGVDQSQISRIEQRVDAKLSTIREYLTGLGATDLKLQMAFADGEQIELPLPSSSGRQSTHSAQTTGGVVRLADWRRVTATPVGSAMAAQGADRIFEPRDAVPLDLRAIGAGDTRSIVEIQPRRGWCRLLHREGPPVRMGDLVIDRALILRRHDSKVSGLEMPDDTTIQDVTSLFEVDFGADDDDA